MLSMSEESCVNQNHQTISKKVLPERSAKFKRVTLSHILHIGLEFN